MEDTGMFSTLLILRAIEGELNGQEFAISGPAHWVLGRSRSCTLRLPGDGTVSRQHCLIEVEEGGAWIQDLGSLNGTLVNGEKIGQRQAIRHGDATMVQPPRHGLQDGDELRICNNRFLVGVTERKLSESESSTRRPLSDWSSLVCI
jgi:pSer/pThr/pTyr-binding forkhead associated (FHA) protein